MRNPAAVARKAEKKRSRRADYAKRRNVRRNNWPQPIYLAETDVMKPDGKGGLEVVGKRREWKKARVGSRIAAYDQKVAEKYPRLVCSPKSRKFVQSKRQKAEEQGVIKKLLSRVTAEK